MSVRSFEIKISSVDTMKRSIVIPCDNSENFFTFNPVKIYNVPAIAAIVIKAKFIARDQLIGIGNVKITLPNEKIRR